MRVMVILLFGSALANPAVARDVTFKPTVEVRLRYESVEQDEPAPLSKDRDSDALTMRVRAGGEVSTGHLSMLGEVEGTLAIAGRYNAFPFPSTSDQRRPDYPTIADPENIDLNRLQLQYNTSGFVATIGRQRINLDDQRFVGGAAWRQNEQTYDAVRVEAKVGPVQLDGSYAIAQRTIYGIEARARQSYGGDFIFLNAGVKQGPIALKGFAYLLDYDESVVFANSSQTYGVRAVVALPLGPRAKMGLIGSYAHQSAYGLNPNAYAADYVLLEGTFDYARFKVTGGYELLGSDGRANFAFQTPLATLHRFNGWADKFLTTPTTGLQDMYAGIGYGLPKLGNLGPLVAGFTYHRFYSDRANIFYGDEYDMQVTLKVNKRMSALIKYADYRRNGIASYTGDADTQKFWGQIDYAL
jgi:hypothetical protein